MKSQVLPRLRINMSAAWHSQYLCTLQQDKVCACGDVDFASNMRRNFLTAGKAPGVANGGSYPIPLCTHAPHPQLTST